MLCRFSLAPACRVAYCGAGVSYAHNGVDCKYVHCGGVRGVVFVAPPYPFLFS